MAATFVVERRLRRWGRHWYLTQTRARVLLCVFTCAQHYTQHLPGFYFKDFNPLTIVSALLTSAALAWFFYSGRCQHLRGLEKYRGQRDRALARLSLAFDDGGASSRGTNSEARNTGRNEDGGGEWDGSGTWEDRHVSLRRGNWSAVTMPRFLEA